jgi:hypothetical protein
MGLARAIDRGAFLLMALLLAASSCGPPTVRPVSSPDPEAACPGGAAGWNLDLADQRAERPDSVRVLGGIRDSLAKSFPGCRWDAEANRGTIRVEVHRFQVAFDGETWNAAVEWSVLAQDPGRRTLTQFDATAEIERPNYRGVNNEKAALQEAFDQAMSRTIAGLRNVRSLG